MENLENGVKQPSLVPENCDESSPINILFFTSFIFITNVISALYKENHLYAILFGLLTISSLIVHSYDNIYTNVIDKIIIGLIVIYGGYVLWNKMSDIDTIIMVTIISTFLFCIWVYAYGFYKKRLCFDSDKCIADRYHCLMHLIGCIGHHLIIF